MDEFYLSEDDEILLDEEWNVIENDKKLPYMLFDTISGVFPMERYKEDLRHINDYIFYNNENLTNILKKKEESIQEAKNTDVYGEYRGEAIMARESEKIAWEFIIKETNKCNNIVLFLSFLEGVLKEILEWFAEEKKYTIKNKKRSEYKIIYYLREISSCCNYDLIEKLKKELKIINDARTIRNIFVHEWDAYYNRENNVLLDEKLEEFRIVNLIDTISRIIYMCEYAGIKSGVLGIEDNPIGRYLTMERIERINKYIKDDEDCLLEMLKEYAFIIMNNKN